MNAPLRVPTRTLTPLMKKLLRAKFKNTSGMPCGIAPIVYGWWRNLAAKNIRRDWRFREQLERHPRAQLQLAARRHCHGDGPELRRVHKPVRRAEINLVECVERFRAELKCQALREIEGACERQIQCTRRWSVKSIASDIAVSEGRRRRKRSGIEPFIRRVRAGAENRLTGRVRADRILAQNCSRIRGIAKNGYRKRHTRLELIDRGQMPVLRDQPRKFGPAIRGNVVDRADRKSMPRIATESLFQCQVAIV